MASIYERNEDEDDDEYIVKDISYIENEITLSVCIHNEITVYTTEIYVFLSILVSVLRAHQWIDITIWNRSVAVKRLSIQSYDNDNSNEKC